MYHDVHTGIGSAILTVAALTMTGGRFLRKWFRGLGRHRII